jgi:hypothetical protein
LFGQEDRYYISKSKDFLVALIKFFPYVYCSGVVLNLLGKPIDAETLLDSFILKPVMLLIYFLFFYCVYNFRVGYYSVSISKEGLNIFHKSSNEPEYFLSWNSINEVKHKNLRPLFLENHEIKLLCSKEGMETNKTSLTKEFPSGLVPVVLPWPLQNPKEFYLSLLQNVPSDNPLHAFLTENEPLFQ